MGAMGSGKPLPRLRRLSTTQLTAAEILVIRAIMDEAFGDGEEAFAEDDWTHALGGTHFMLDLDGEIVTHASVVERLLHVGDRPLRTGYVEAVATAPAHHGRGYGSQVMEAVTTYIRETFELGALGTGRHRFYERLGWETWAGPAFVRTPDGLERTPDDEGYILVLRPPTSPAFAIREAIVCESRVGEDW
jgi:aminoglycoside 2'-N-acetyltransferase I